MRKEQRIPGGDDLPNAGSRSVPRDLTICGTARGTGSGDGSPSPQQHLCRHDDLYRIRVILGNAKPSTHPQA